MVAQETNASLPRQDQAGKSSTGDGSGNGRHAVVVVGSGGRNIIYEAAVGGLCYGGYLEIEGMRANIGCVTKVV